jgi:hypothetical protein
MVQRDGESTYEQVEVRKWMDVPLHLLSQIGASFSGVRSFGLPLLATIILFSITVTVLLCQQLCVWYLRIVSPCPEWVDQMWMSVGGRDGRASSGNDSNGNGSNSNGGSKGMKA